MSDCQYAFGLFFLNQYSRPLAESKSEKTVAVLCAACTELILSEETIIKKGILEKTSLKPRNMIKKNNLVMHGMV
jgi:hypothetical protein